MLGSISQHRLHDATLLLEDARLQHASLFPIFDGAGQTHALMLTRADDPEIWLFPWHPDLVERGPWRPIKLRASWRELSASAEPIELDSLWHFDPWWELGHARYAIHPLVPALKDTNIPGHDDSLTRFWFDRTLRRATWVARRGDEASELKRFSPARLSAADDTRRAARGVVVEQKRRGEWRLRPFWS